MNSILISFRRYMLLAGMIPIMLIQVSIASGRVIVNYEIVGKLSPQESEEYIVENGRPMYSGEILKVRYELVEGEAVYIILQSQSGFHYLLNEGSTSPEKNIENSTDWYQLDFEPGKETIYIIVSAFKDKKLNDYFSLLDKSQEVEENKLNRNIARRIASIKNTAAKLLEKKNSPSHPVDPVVTESDSIEEHPDDPIASGAIFRGYRQQINTVKIGYNELNIIHKN